VEAPQGEYSAVLSKKGLIKALGVQGGAEATAGDSGCARAVLTQRRFPRSVVEGSRSAPEGWRAAPFGGSVPFSGLLWIVGLRGPGFRSLYPEALGSPSGWGGRGRGLQASTSLETSSPRHALFVPRLQAGAVGKAFLTGY
jgi:hypothetical protein